VEAINHIVLHCPEEGLDKFEEISYLLKNKDTVKMEKFLLTGVDKPYAKYDGFMKTEEINALKA
jgi:hypothetical protein